MKQGFQMWLFPRLPFLSHPHCAWTIWSNEKQRIHPHLTAGRQRPRVPTDTVPGCTRHQAVQSGEIRPDLCQMISHYSLQNLHVLSLSAGPYYPSCDWPLPPSECAALSAGLRGPDKPGPTSAHSLALTCRAAVALAPGQPLGAQLVLLLPARPALPCRAHGPPPRRCTQPKRG